MKSWEERVQEYENQGLTRSDAQAVVDAEDLKMRNPLQMIKNITKQKNWGNK